MPAFKVYYGDGLWQKMPSVTYQASNEHEAKRMFRNEFGFNYIKIQHVEEVKIETKESPLLRNMQIYNKTQLSKMKKAELIDLVLSFQDSTTQNLELIERYQGEIAELVAELGDY